MSRHSVASRQIKSRCASLGTSVNLDELSVDVLQRQNLEATVDVEGQVPMSDSPFLTTGGYGHEGQKDWQTAGQQKGKLFGSENTHTHTQRQLDAC